MTKSKFAATHEISEQLIHATAKRFERPYLIDAIEFNGNKKRFDMCVQTQVDDLTLFYVLNWQFLGVASVVDMTFIGNNDDQESCYIVHFASAYDNE